MKSLRNAFELYPSIDSSQYPTENSAGWHAAPLSISPYCRANPIEPSGRDGLPYEILVGEEVKRVGPGAIMHCAGNKLHGIKKTGETRMVFYFYKWLV